MRYDDASGAFQASGPIANDDAETLSAGQKAATGNVITGEGTQYGASGADSAAGAHVTAIAGKGGEDSSFSGGKLAVEGEHGRLTIDADGNYNYVVKGNVENVRDRFTYTLADNAGNSDTAALIVEIGKTPAVIKANAQQIVPGPDGVVTLPPGVELSDVHVVGRNLVVDLPDGTQLVIVDGAIFVPQLVLGGVEVPATNVAALLIGQEVQPAAGETPPSGGGNFALPPPPLDPGIPLGDLIPPTELTYVPPEPQEVLDILDREPEIFIQPDGQPASVAAVDSVDEKGLPTRNGGEPEGSGEEAAAGANGDPSEATAGTIIINSPDGVASVTINGVLVTGLAGQQIVGAFGTLTITGFDGDNILYSYVLNDNTSGNDTQDDFSVTLTDDDGDQATATLTIDIIDDVPTARPDTDAIAAGQFGPVTGNVITDASAGDAGDGDNGRDTVGADNASITSVSSANVPANSDGSAPFVVNGQYGVLTLQANGDYSYTRNPGTPGGVNDVFNYTLTDGDGDTSSTTLTISIADAVPETRPNPTAQLDDDALPGGIPGGTGDDPDAANLSGNLLGVGGDGPLTFDLLLTGAPAGFTYVDGPGGAVHVMQGSTHVLTITLNASTGAYTVSQVNPIDHSAGGDENNAQFTINYTVTDQDGDAANGTLNIDVDDDTPDMNRADVSLPTLTVDETNLALNASADYSVVFDGAFGADGPGSISFAVSVVNGTDSGLVDVATGDPILLFNNAGVVEGRVGGEGGAVAFTVSVNSSTGVVTLDQVRALEHPLNPNNDEPVSAIADSVQLTASITDGDGDGDSLTVNIGHTLVFEDDGPSVSPTLNANATVTVDESLPSSAPGIDTGAIVKGDDPDLAGGLALGQANSGSAIVDANAVFGADGPAAGGGISYALSITNANPGVTLTDGTTITMQLVGGVIVGVVDAGPFAGQAAFAIAIDADTGVVTVEQYLSLDHPVNPDPNDPLGLGDNTVAVTVTATDGDGDWVTSDGIDISGQITFLDDGPTVDPALNARAEVTVDESLPSTAPTIDTGAIVKGDDPDLGGGLALGFGTSGAAVVNASAVFGADGPEAEGGVTYALSILGVSSGVTLTDGSAINLQLVGGVIVGVVASGAFAGQAAFAIAIDANTGVVTVEQYLSLDHPVNPDPNDPLGLGDNTVGVTVTGTDGDGDPVTSDAVDISSLITFLDDGPSADPVLEQEATVTVDESLPSAAPAIDTLAIVKGDDPDLAGGLAIGSGNSGIAVIDVNALFGADGPAAGGGVSYALSVLNASSGLTLTDGSAINLQLLANGVVVGVVASGAFAGQAAFAIAINSTTGVVSVEQYLSLDHPVNPDPNDPLGLGENTLGVTATVTDGDGDSITTDAVDISDQVTFLDDGPAVNPAVNAQATVTVDESLPSSDPAINTGAIVKGNDPDLAGGIALGQANSGSAIVNANAVFGADGPAASGSVTYALSIINAASGLTLTDGTPINLQMVGGVIVGVVNGGPFNGQAAFAIAIDANTGVVSVEQYLSLDHPVNPDPNDPLSFGANIVGVTVTATDGDGDPVTSGAVDIGGQITFLDDGPSATNDVDVIIGGNGPATGNVITGVDFGGGDANATDGSADAPGADGVGAITNIVSNNTGASDNTYTAGNLVVNGQYGVLTINANGNYSYLRNDGTPGGVSDVFTYTLTDGDGDPVTATLTISIDDNFPQAGSVNVQLDDETLAGGNPGGTGDVNPDLVNVSGNLPGSGGDGALTFNLQLTGAPAGFSYVSGGANVVLVQQGGVTVFTVTITNAATGAYTVVQNNPLDHSAGGNENNAQFTINYTVTDADNDVANGTINVDVDDDTPTVSANSAVQLDDDALAGGNPGGTGDVNPDTANTSGTLGHSFGADGGSIAYLTSGAPAGFTYELSGNNLLIKQGATTVVTVTLNTATGAYTVTQNNPIDHSAGGAENDVAFTINYRVTDGDGDTADGSMVINVDDDTPTVSANAAVQLDDESLAGGIAGGTGDVNPNTANTSGTLGHSFGADGAGTVAYLTSGAPAGFTYELSGNDLLIKQGATTVITLTVNPTTGAYTVTQNNPIQHPAGADENDVSFTINYRVTDGDGDPVDGSMVINVDDDTPTATIVETGQSVSVDESVGVQVDSNDTTAPGVIALFAGVTNTGTDTHLPQYAQNASAIVASTGSSVGADAPGTTAFSLNVSAAGVDSGLNTTGGQDILLFKEGSLIVGRVSGGADDGKAAFAIAIDPVTGVVSMVEYLSIQHPNAANPDDSVSITDGAILAVVTVTDADGDVATQSVGIGSAIQFQDSAPVMTAASNINIQNSGDVAHTGQFAFNLGADGANISTNDVITNVTGSATVGGVAVQNWTLTPGVENATTASYSFSFDYPIGGGNTAHETGTLVFDKVAGTYTVDLANPIQGVTTILQTAQGTLFQGYEFGTSTPDGSQPEISVTQIQDLAGTANDIYVQFTSVSEPSSGTGDDNLEVTNWVPGADNPPPVNGGGDTSWSAGQLFNQVDGWVSTSNSANGVDGDTIQGGEVLDFSLVQGANPTGNLANPSTYAQASAMFLKFDGIGASEDMIVVLKLYDPNTNTYTTRAIMVENADIQKGPGAGPGQYSGITLDQNDGLVIIESNDYNNPGENWVIVGAQIAGSDEGVTGTAIDLNSAIGAAGDSDTNNNGSLDTDALGFQSDTNDGPFKISSIGFLTTSTTPQNAQLDFNVTVTDGDGDSITQAIQATVTAAADSSTPIALGGGVTTISQAPLSTKSSSVVADSYQPSHQTAANNNVGNTGITSAMVAASGLAAISTGSLDSFSQPSFDSLVQDSFQSLSTQMVGRESLDEGLASISFGNELSEPSVDAVNLSSSGFSFDDHGFGGGSLDSMSFGDAEPAYMPSYASGEPAVANIPVFAANVPTVSMASAEMLRAVSLDGKVQHGGAVEQVLADALGHQAPTIDGALANLPGGIGELAELANLASPDAAGVPAWDMGMQGGFAPMHDMLIKVAAIAVHQDAVQPA